MLARTVLSPADLDISEHEHSLLLKVLTRLEANPPPHINERPTAADGYLGAEPDGFNMKFIFGSTSCGTAACLLGWALAMNGHADSRNVTLFGTSWSNADKRTRGCQELFCPDTKIISQERYCEITVEQAAQALRNYLATGWPNWQEVLPDKDPF